MSKNGMNYAPQGVSNKVVDENEFIFSVVGLDHGHIYGMTNGLLEAGATLKYVFDKDTKKMEDFVKKYPMIKRADSLEVVLNDKDTMLVASACITNERADLGVKVMESGKDYFVDKAPFTTLEQIEKVRNVISKTHKKYIVYYSELIHVEGVIYAKKLVDEGAIGEVVQVLSTGPHRLNASDRPDWFFEKEKYGGILCDIGSHNIYQYLEFANIDNATLVSSQVGNFNNSKYPELEDFGDASFTASNGSTHYFRVDWLTPDGLSTWGDGRLFVLGTEGYIEVRKYIDPGKTETKDNVIFVNKEGENFDIVTDKVGFPFFGELILDCINRTENAQTQHRAIKASELSIIAENEAVKIR